MPGRKAFVNTPGSVPKAPPIPPTAGAEASALTDSKRLAALVRTRLLDSPVEEPYDRIARLSARVMAAPIATVTLLDADRQFYKACVGIPEPLSTIRETTLEYSFCKHTVALGTPLVIPDTLEDSRVAHIPSVTEFGVRAYAGVPLLVDGEAIGTLCVMDLVPRLWSDDAVGCLIDLAASVVTEIELRMSIGDLETSQAYAVAARAEAERANAAKGEFLAMVSHDLRTPLNAIGGYRQLLEMEAHGPMNSAQRQMLTRIERASDHLLRLVNQVLSFARAEATSEPLPAADLAVDETLRALESLIRPQLDDNKLTYVYDGVDLTTRMRADGDGLSRILLNLLSNAIKFTPPAGRVTLAWTVEAHSVVIEVTDTGAGIPARLVDTIFEPFVRLPGQTATNPDGIGLGLAISRRLARAMLGELTVSSIEGEGTTFRLRVPRSPDVTTDCQSQGSSLGP